MTRLTKSIKEQICKNAIEQSPVTKELKTVNENLSKLALDVYNDNVTSELLKEADEIRARAKELPFYYYSVFQICDGVRCNFNGLRAYLKLPPERVFYRLDEGPTYTADHEFSKRFLSLQNQVENSEKQIEDLRQEIMAILNSCATLKKLQEVWPESVNFLDGIQADVIKTNLPAVVVENLNKKLGITAG
ncbi:Nmad5 family putative nucleotide modification protein [Gilliamella sp. Occ3-1]|uniref:Nmad5 family putative nucleotide modification protein n=1 Tax=Gilliamella sp. Occ3-1 TaxID=3120253 RepID=UPI0009BF2864|nr:Nmad5 family putative nucleotide modification protein [Gilliamella apicola]